VLVVEDDHGLRELLARGLREQGFLVMTAVDGSSALKAASGGALDAIVLDVGLPDSDGRDVCVALRSRGIDVPVLFLTARNNLTDRLSGFAAGGDDYLGKPFAFPELVVRLRALLRRATDPSLALGDLRLDPASHAMSLGDVQLPLSPTEFRLLAKLMSTPQVSDNTLDQYISKLRRKLVEIGADAAIEAARGLGYRFV
jgi:two-component system response regulator MprA